MLIVTHSGTPLTALVFLHEPHCADLYPSLVSEHNLLCLVLLRLCIAKKTLSPGLLFSLFDVPRFYLPFVSDATMQIQKSGKTGKMLNIQNKHALCCTINDYCIYRYAYFVYRYK